MDPEILEIRRHLGAYPPFDALDDEWLDQVAEAVEIAYFRAGSQILEASQPIDALYYVRSGAVEVYRRSGDLFDRLGAGGIFGHYGLLRGGRVRYPAIAIEDTLIYRIPAATFDALCDASHEFSDFIELGRPRLETSGGAAGQGSELMSTRVRKLLTREPLIIEAWQSAQTAALRLADEPSAALLVVDQPGDDPRYTYADGDGHLWQVQGIVTDADLRSRIIAAGRDHQTPIGEIVHDDLIAVQSDETVQEAMLAMLRHNVAHLVVLHRRRPIGLIQLQDVVRFETRSSLYLIDSILASDSVQALATLKPDVWQSAVRMIDEGADSRTVGTALASIARSFMRRIIELAEAELGPPPVPYAFMVMGSMARGEQTLVTDQDNALVLDDRFDPGAHDEYFSRLARRVSDGLDACGYRYCKGDIMATNPRWRQPLAQWQRYFRRWIDDPNPERLLHSNIFFDLDNVHGEERYVERLQALIAENAGNSPRFMAAMARNALNRTPPIGFFRDFVMEKDGRQNNSINVKRRGTAPLTDLIRIHALACGSRAQNSFDRLDDIAETQLLGPGVADRLRDALEILSHTRLRHQAIDIQNDRQPDNNIEPENVPSAERAAIKDAFRALSQAQKFLRFRYPMTSDRPASTGRG
jgi:CBS domain-containing protein